MGLQAAFCVRVAAAILLSVGLGGCFRSATPLITPATASYPIADGARFRVCLKEGDCVVKSTVTVTIKSGYYTMTEYYPDGRVRERKIGLMKEVSLAAYAAMVGGGKDGYEYVLFVRDGGTYKRYDLGKKELAPLDCAKFNAVVWQNRACDFSDFQSLKKAYEHLLKNIWQIRPNTLYLPL